MLWTPRKRNTPRTHRSHSWIGAARRWRKSSASSYQSGMKGCRPIVYGDAALHARLDAPSRGERPVGIQPGAPWVIGPIEGEGERRRRKRSGACVRPERTAAVARVAAVGVDFDAPALEAALERDHRPGLEQIVGRPVGVVFAAVGVAEERPLARGRDGGHPEARFVRIARGSR